MLILQILVCIFIVSVRWNERKEYKIKEIENLIKHESTLVYKSFDKA